MEGRTAGNSHAGAENGAAAGVNNARLRRFGEAERMGLQETETGLSRHAP